MSNINVDSCRVSSQLTVHKTDDAIGFVSTIMENGIVYSQSTVIWLEDIKVVFLNAEKEVMFNYLYVVLKNRKRFQFALGICYDDEINTAVSQLKEMLGEKFEERIDE